MIFEVWLESAPQLATQWILLTFSLQRNSALPLISVTTSTFTITLAMINFVAQNRREEWIKPGYPAAASLTPIGLVVISALAVATMQLFAISNVTYIPIVMNIAASILTIFVIYMPCGSRCLLQQTCWRVIHTLIHFLLTGGSLACYVRVYVLSYTDESFWYYNYGVFDAKFDLLFLFTMFWQLIHFLLGLVIFSGLNTARLFAPILVAAKLLVRKIVNLCCCCGKWRNSINAFLDIVLAVEEVGNAETEDGVVELEDVTVATVATVATIATVATGCGTGNVM